MQDLGFEPHHQAILIGDSDVDMGAALAAGVQGLRVASAGKYKPAAEADFLDVARLSVASVAERETRIAAGM